MQATPVEKIQTMRIKNIAKLLSQKFAEGSAERDRDASFVYANFDLLRENRIFSALIPADLGGGGQSHSQMAHFIRTIAHASPGTALALSMHQHLISAAVFNHRHGKPGLKILQRVASQEISLVSTGANDWLESNGEAVRVDGGYEVTAVKPFASGSPAGTLMITSAPYNDPEEGWQVLHFPVPLAAKGVTLAGDWDTLGMRDTGSQTMILKDVFVPDEAIALKRPQAEYHPAFNVILTVALPLIMSAYVGAAEAAVEIALKQVQRKIGDEVLPYLVGEMKNHLTMAQLAVDDMIAIADDLNFNPSAEMTSDMICRKTIAANAVKATVEKAIEASGGQGYFKSLGLEKILRDVYASQFHPLQEKRQHRFTGRVLLGQEPV